MAVVLLGMTGDNARADEARVISLDLVGASSSGATPVTTFKQ
jgi:hypothetical protein